MTLSQRIVTIFAIIGSACASTTLCRVIVLRIGRQLNPLQIVAVHKDASVDLVRQAFPFGLELYAHRLHLLVEVFEIFHTRGVERVAENPWRWSPFPRASPALRLGDSKRPAVSEILFFQNGIILRFNWFNESCLFSHRMPLQTSVFLLPPLNSQSATSGFPLICLSQINLHA